MRRKFGRISAKSRGAILMKGLPYKSTGKEEYYVLRDKINFAVRFGNCFL